MIQLNILDETAPLKAVVLGNPNSFGGVPSIEDAYDPKSILNIRKGTFPLESDIRAEMKEVDEVFSKYNVKVYRPETIENTNQVFSRDIGFVIGDHFVIPRILDKRKNEIKGIESIIGEFDNNKVFRVDGQARIEGGDVMPHKGKIFVGYSEDEDFNKYVVSRTNKEGVNFLKKSFPDWEIVSFELSKSDTDPMENALHLDCCFQPIGKNQAIIYEGGFKNPEDAEYLVNFFGKENVIQITKEEMFQMCSNVFSISPEVIISEKGFLRLNKELRKRKFIVEEVKYSEIAKMEGLLRCSTLPLTRAYV